MGAFVASPGDIRGNIVTLLYASQAELQWKLEDCNKMWGECKVRPSHGFLPLGLIILICIKFLFAVQKEAGQKDRLLQQLKHKREVSQSFKGRLKKPYAAKHPQPLQ